MAKRRIRAIAQYPQRTIRSFADALKHSNVQREARSDSRIFQSNDLPLSYYPESSGVVSKDVH